MKAYFKNGRCWLFSWCEAEKCWFYRTRENTYRLFFDNSEYVQVWIGRLIIDQAGRQCWFTVEHQLGITKVDTGDLEIIFK